MTVDSDVLERLCRAWFCDYLLKGEGKEPIVTSSERSAPTRAPGETPDEAKKRKRKERRLLRKQKAEAK